MINLLHSITSTLKSALPAQLFSRGESSPPAAVFPFNELPRDLIPLILQRVNDCTAIPCVSRQWKAWGAESKITNAVKQRFSPAMQIAFEKLLGNRQTASQVQIVAYELLMHEMSEGKLKTCKLHKKDLRSLAEADRLIEVLSFNLFCQRIPGLSRPPIKVTSDELAIFYREALKEFDCTQIRILNLTNPSQIRIPEDICRFRHLRVLDLRIYDYGMSIYGSLPITLNDLKSIPKTIADLIHSKLNNSRHLADQG